MGRGYSRVGSSSTRGRTSCSPRKARAVPVSRQICAERGPRTAFAGLPITNSHNTRAATLTFHIPHGGALHGLVGYFEAVLYGGRRASADQAREVLGLDRELAAAR